MVGGMAYLEPLNRFTRYEMAKARPINAYPIANGLKFAGINMVNKPRAAADTNITRPTNLRAA